jgi:hypothetical protein
MHAVEVVTILIKSLDNQSHVVVDIQIVVAHVYL